MTPHWIGNRQLRVTTACTATLALASATLVVAAQGYRTTAPSVLSVEAADTVVGPMPRQSTVEMGETTTVLVHVQDAMALYGADVRLAFDPTYLGVVDADPSKPGIQIQALSTFLAPDYVVRQSAENEEGTIWYAVTQLQPSQPVSGTGALAAITFRGLVAGTSPITVTYQKLVRRDGSTIASRAEHGAMTVTIDGQTATPGTTPTRRPTSVRSPTPRETDEPTEIIPPTHVPSSTAVAGTQTPATQPTSTPALGRTLLYLPFLSCCPHSASASESGPGRRVTSNLRPITR